jgi:hypothetical protein
VKQCLIAAVHREWHGIMHVGDLPTAIIAAKACGGAKEKLNLFAIGLGSSHSL